MFKDDYRSATEHITASNELKLKTLDKINAKEVPKLNRFVRYGLVFASFLFIVSMFPVLYGKDGLSIDSNAPRPNATMPQTGVDDSITRNIDNSLRQHYKSSEAIKKELEQKQAELDALKIEKKEQDEHNSSTGQTSSALALEPQKEPENIDNKIQAYEKEIKIIEQKLGSGIQVQETTPNKVTLNVISQPVASMKIKDFTTDPNVTVEDWTQPQIVEHLAVSPVPSYVPEDLTWGYPQNDETFTQKVFINKSDNSFVYDTFSYSFAAPQLTRELNPLRRVLRVEVSKGKLPLTDCFYMKEDANVSTIIGVEMKLGIGQVPYAFNDKKEPTSFYELYVAEFIHNDVGYRMVSSNLSQKEFTDVITSVIVPTK